MNVFTDHCIQLSKIVFFPPALDSLKGLASLLMHVSADNRMLMQIKNSNQNGWVLLQMGGVCLNRQCFVYYVSSVYFWILVCHLDECYWYIAGNGSFG